jgi:AcrR family transcriptional regulator
LRTTEQYDKEKLKILSFVTEKFHKEGFYKTSMDEIAGELRISKKTIYKYFPSKEQLLEVICRKTNDEITNYIRDIIDGEGDVITKIVRILNMYSNFTLSISEKWLNDLRIHYPSIIKSLDTFKDGLLNGIFRKLIEQGKKEKLIENYPDPIIINSFISTIQSLLHTDFIINNKFSLQDAFKYTFDMLFNGILTTKGKERYKTTMKKFGKEINL